MSNNNYREAHEYFNKANNVIEGYKDASQLSVKYKNIADEKDALSHYENGTVSAKAEKYRDASEQFEKATSFVANFKDSQALAIKYKEMADNKDAQSHYERGMEFVKSKHYREAAEQFEKSSTFVSNYKESQSLSSKYKLLADENDAKLHYEKGQSFFNAKNYADAEKEFLASESFIKGYKDAIALAKKSSINESIKLVLNIDTPDYTVKEAAQKMINENNTEFFKVLMKQFQVESDYRVQNNLLRALSFYVDPDWFRLVKSIVDRGRTRQYDIVWAGIISLHGNICKANPKFDTCGNVIPFMCKLYCFDPDKDTFQGVKRVTYEFLSSYSYKKDFFSECIKMNPGCK